MRVSRVALALALALAALRATPASAFSAGAGSCEHAGVAHGVERMKTGGEAFEIRIGGSGLDVPGATIPLEIRGARKFKGFLLRVTTEDGRAVGSFGEDMPSGTRTADGCERFATHALGHSRGYTSTVMPWIVPELRVGTVVRFEATIVEAYETWYAIERTAKTGEGTRDEDVAFDEDRMPVRAPGTGARAPSEDKAMEGGWRRAPQGEREAKREAEAPTRKVRDRVEDKRARVQSEDRARRRRLSDATLVHGALMGIAWLVLSPGATLVARHWKKYDPWWFRVHRNSQVAAVALTIVAAYVIISARGWSKSWGRHGKIGMCVLLLGGAQAGLGFIRKSVPRPEFRRWHRYLGVGTGVLAAYNCSIGADIARRHDLRWDPTSPAIGAPRLVNLCLFVLVVSAAVLESQRAQTMRARKSSRSMV